MNKMLNKNQVFELLSSIKTVKPISKEFVFDVYDISYNSILDLEQKKILSIGQPINSLTLIYYIIGEYTYSMVKRNDEEKERFDHNEQIKIQMASVVVDKYMSLEVFDFKPEVIANKFLPPISSLDTYVNFMVNLLNKLPKNKPNETLIIDLLNKSASALRCILRLLCDGFETEAMATWRTLHESECILILLDRYGENLVNTYLTHMKYGIAYRAGLKTKEETDEIFAIIKSKMKDHGLKSKDMKKFIEYGWLYETKESKADNFKLNFRDGLEIAAGLRDYSSIYEQSSEIVHSTPMLIYSNKVYYYLLTIVSTYESFFRLEEIFSHYCFNGQFKAVVTQYEQMKKIYFPQLLTIYKNEMNRFIDFTKHK